MKPSRSSARKSIQASGSKVRTAPVGFFESRTYTRPFVSRTSTQSPPTQALARLQVPRVACRFVLTIAVMYTYMYKIMYIFEKLHALMERGVIT
jgi:hypothetical protein